MAARKEERHIRVVETYERLHRHVSAWVDHDMPCLMLIGPPGTLPGW